MNHAHDSADLIEYIASTKAIAVNPIKLILAEYKSNPVYMAAEILRCRMECGRQSAAIAQLEISIAEQRETISCLELEILEYED